MSEYDVIIVGGGPVGVGLAVELGRRDVSCVVVEKRAELSSIPKGQGLSQRTLEHFARWGLAEELRAARVMPRDLPIGQVTVYRDLTSEHWRAKPSREVVQAYYAETNERLPQYCTEEVLRREMRRLPGVRALLGVEAVHVEQDPEEVRLTVQDGGENRTLTGRFLVGCDGGRSMVREQADIARTGTDWDKLVTLIVFRSRHLHEELASRYPERSTYRVMHPDLEGYWRFFGRVDGDEQFFFHAPVPHGTDPATFDPQASLDEAAGFAIDATIDYVGFWDLRVQVATTYRRHRVFIAGDAAHTHPPYGGFGLNNGLEDAVNLGWKLAAVVRGWGGEGLLNSYSEERQPVFRGVGEEIIGGWIAEDRRFLQEHDPARDPEAFEDAFSRMAAGFGERLRRFEPHYTGSSIVIGPDRDPTSAIGEHKVQARAGHHLAPKPLSSKISTFHSLGPWFTLLGFDADRDDLDRMRRAAAELGVPLEVVIDTSDEGRDEYEAALVLVRPDQFVAWTDQRAPQDPAAMLRAVSGR